MRCRGAKSFVDDLGRSRGVVLSRAVRFCDLLRLSPLTRRFVRFRRTSLLFFPFFSISVCGYGRRRLTREKCKSHTTVSGLSYAVKQRPHAGGPTTTTCATGRHTDGRTDGHVRACVEPEFLWPQCEELFSVRDNFVRVGIYFPLNTASRLGPHSVIRH